MFGSHLSVAGGMVNALNDAETLGLDCVQVFTKNQQQWKVKPLKDADRDVWLTKLGALGWRPGDGEPPRCASHASYLINLASPDDELWKKSIGLMVEEIERCEALEIPLLVHHPGAYTTSDETSGLKRIASAYKRLLKETAGFRTVLCLENTVGSGSNLGAPFEQLATLRGLIVDATGASDRVGFCFDTCHAHAAGYSMATRDEGQAVLSEFDRTCGLEHLRVMHLNDSKGEVGSRKDRHAHVGEGTLTLAPGRSRPRLKDSGFAAVVNHPKLRRVPKILETPKGEDEQGRSFDLINVGKLKRMIDR
ncbi:MAG: deoxyribonuclease IV [Planctomycetota bacterium]